MAIQQKLQSGNVASKGKISLVLNQPVYAPGDTAFFSVWYTDEYLHPKKGEIVMIMNLYDGQGEIKSHQKIRIRNGHAASTLALSDGLSPGRYQLAMATPSMLAGAARQYFSQWIEIESSKNLQPLPRFSGFPDRVFVEGHHLVQQIPVRVMVIGRPGEVVAIRANEVIVDKVSIPAAGIGSCVINPELGVKYDVLFHDENRQVALPAVRADGITLFLRDDHILVKIPKGSAYGSRPLLLAGINRNTCMDARPIVIETSTNEVKIPLPAPVPGFTEYYVADEAGNPLAHRKVLAHIQPTRVHLELPGSVRQRDSVPLKIAVQANELSARSGTFAISIVQKKLFEDRSLISPFPVTPFAAVNQFLAHPVPEVDVNDLLCAFPEPYFLHAHVEIGEQTPDDLRIRGSVVSAITNNPAPDSTLVLAFLQKNTMGYETFTRNGQFEIRSMLDFWNDETVFVSLKNRSQTIDATHRVTLLEDSLRVVEKWSSNETADRSVFGEYAQVNRLISNSFQFYSHPSGVARDMQNPNRLLEEEFLEPDYVVDVSKYVVFPTVEVLIKEAVPFVQIRRARDQKNLRLAYRTDNTTNLFKSNPLLVIDGFLTFDLQYFLNLNPSDISYIKVLNNPNKLSRLGRLGDAGVLFIQTKKQNAGGARPRSHYLNVVGLTRPEVNNRVATIIDPRIPDFRSTLYWNGSVRVPPQTAEVNLRFKASDDLGTMVVMVAGFTDEGLWLYQTTTFEVTRKD